MGRESVAALPEGLGDALDEVRATVLTLLASLQEKERTLRQRAAKSPSSGVDAGLADIEALRAWADKTLATLDTFARGRTGELPALLAELDEFEEIVHAHDAD